MYNGIEAKAEGINIEINSPRLFNDDEYFLVFNPIVCKPDWIP